MGKDKLPIIVWVYGASGAGKETFLKYMTSKKSKQLINRLGWKNKKIIPIKESVDYLAQYDEDPQGDKRKDIIDKVIKISKKPNLVILIKGQDIDLEAKLPQKLRKKLPRCSHQVIYLHTNPKTLLLRCKPKKWWDNRYSITTLKKWTSYQLRLLSKLKAFEIIALDSGNGKNYISTIFPPKNND